MGRCCTTCGEAVDGPRRLRCQECRHELERSRCRKKAATPENRRKTAAYRKKIRVKGGPAHEREKQRNRDSKYRLRYGISEFVYQEMLRAQGGLCAICKRPETRLKHGRIKRLAVDHDHETGRVRGLLCHQCNAGIGNFRDSSILLESASVYIKQESPLSFHRALRSQNDFREE